MRRRTKSGRSEFMGTVIGRSERVVRSGILAVLAGSERPRQALAPAERSGLNVRLRHRRGSCRHWRTGDQKVAMEGDRVNPVGLRAAGAIIPVYSGNASDTSHTDPKRHGWLGPALGVLRFGGSIDGTALGPHERHLVVLASEVIQVLIRHGSDIAA